MTIHEYTREQEMKAIMSVLATVAPDAGTIDCEQMGADLVVALNRAGTRDAFLVLAFGMERPKLEVLAQAIRLCGQPAEDPSYEVRSNYWSVLGGINYLLGHEDSAVHYLNQVEGPHKMSELLIRCMQAGIDGYQWALTMQRLSVEVCMNYSRPAVDAL